MMQRNIALVNLRTGPARNSLSMSGAPNAKAAPTRPAPLRVCSVRSRLLHRRRPACRAI